MRSELASRLKFVDGPFDLRGQLAEIRTCALFILSTWSGHCSASFSAFCNAVSQTPAGAFAVHIVDNDYCNLAECEKILGAISQQKLEL